MESQFSKQSELYARYRPSYPEDLYKFILAHLNNKNVAWDCCTGTGQVASYLSGHFKKVYANDISREQLKHAPEKDNIDYFRVPAEETGFPSGIFDLIAIAQAIHWLDFEEFYEEVKRTAAGGALIAVFGYGMVRINEKLNPLIDKFYDYNFSEYFSENRDYLDSHYTTIPFPFDEIESPGFTQRLAWSVNDFEGYLNSWSTVQKFKDEKGFNPAEDLMEEIKPLWPEGEIKDVVFPVFLRLGRI